jgi:uncharacterized RDD family membrane protein YckC
MAANAYLPYVHPKQRALTTPEGVALTIEIASFGTRIGAFLIDFICIWLFIIVVTIVTLLIISGKIGMEPGMFLGGVWMVFLFVMRNFWFILFEASPRGATPGKRMMGIRVVARDGGRLETSSVVARNLVREMEVLLPLMFLGSMGTGYAFLGFGWTLLFLFFPLFNKDRMRAGDLIAGTWVIRSPRPKMLRDLHDDAAHIQQYFNFSPEQIAVYGAYELQTLEGLLRGKDRKAIATVADVIRTKINWPEGDDDRAFLQAYYSAVRGQLEKNMLFGKKRRDKNDVG